MARTKREEAIEQLYDKVGERYRDRGWFFGDEIRALYHAWGGMGAARYVQERLGFREYTLRIPGSERLVYLFAANNDAAQAGLEATVVCIRDHDGLETTER